MNGNALSSSVPALHRGLDVLEHMATRGMAFTLSQIARDMAKDVHELQRTVACLHERGYLTRDAAGVYRLSSKLFRLASANPPQRELVARAYPAMADCARRSGESVHLSVLAEDRILLLAEATGGGLARVSLQMGALLDAETTVSGRVLLAFNPEVRTAAFPAAKPALLKRLEAIRAQGYEFAESGHVEGIWDLGVPIVANDGTATAALTCSWLQLRAQKSRWKDLLPPLQHAAERIAAAV